MVLPTTIGHLLSEQNQPLVSTNPIPCFLLRIARSWLRENRSLGHEVVHLAIVAPRLRRQSRGCRPIPTLSPTRTTFFVYGFIAAAREKNAVLALSATSPWNHPQQPETSMTSGRRACACPTAHRYQSWHSRQS